MENRQIANGCSQFTLTARFVALGSFLVSLCSPYAQAHDAIQAVTPIEKPTAYTPLPFWAESDFLPFLPQIDDREAIPQVVFGKPTDIQLTEKFAAAPFDAIRPYDRFPTVDAKRHPTGRFGPSANGRVDLASGAYVFSPPPYFVAFNPVGPDAAFTLRFHSALAQRGITSAGDLPPFYVPATALVPSVNAAANSLGV